MIEQDQLCGFCKQVKKEHEDFFKDGRNWCVLLRDKYLRQFKMADNLTYIEYLAKEKNLI